MHFVDSKLDSGKIILQRKVNSAEKTINLILKTDYSNGNAQLVKSIVNKINLKWKIT